MLNHPKYRPDIDGLRAIAILSVVAYHAFPHKFLTGYIGVDIFFVISGFLISTIIFNSLEQGQFSLVEFYVRRVKRIFPALIVMMITTYLFGWFLLFSDEFSQLGKHIAGGATFVSNFVLWSESGYFDGLSESKPLLHLWSLGIEEQFYIFWPLLLLVSYRRHIGFLIVTSSILLLSFAFNLTEVLHHHDEAAFYSPLTRFWELMFGGMLAFLNTHKPNLINKKPNINAIVGILLILSGLVMLRGHHAYPGYRALLPVVGAFLTISAGPQAWINRNILANRGLVSIGLISYPLYLWHWTIFSNLHIIEGGTLDLNTRVIAVIASFVMAFLTYWLIEKPIRNRKIQSLFKLNITIALIIIMFLLGLVGYLTFKNEGFEFRKANFYAQQLKALPLENDPKFAFVSCREMFGLPLINNVSCLSNTKQPEFMVLGDSHADSFYLAISKKGASIPAIKIAKPRMLPFVDYVTHEKRDSLDFYDTSTLAVKQALETAEKLTSIKTIILVTRGNLYFSEKHLLHKVIGDEEIKSPDDKRAFVEGYNDLIGRFIKMGKRVILVTEWPELNAPPHNFIPRVLNLNSKVHQDILSRHAVEESQKNYLELISEIKQKNPSIEIYYSLLAFCDDSNCHAKDDKSIYYADNEHLSEDGSYHLLTKFRKWLEVEQNH